MEPGEAAHRSRIGSGQAPGAWVRAVARGRRGTGPMTRVPRRNHRLNLASAWSLPNDDQIGQDDRKIKRTRGKNRAEERGLRPRKGVWAQERGLNLLSGLTLLSGL